MSDFKIYNSPSIYLRYLQQYGRIKRNIKPTNKENEMTELIKLQEKYEELGKEIEALKNSKKSGVWKPKDGENYYFIDIFGSVRCESFSSSAYRDIHNLATGNFYKTEELAQAALDQQIAKQKLIECIAKHNQGWLPDWSDVDEYKHYFFLHYSGVISYTCTASSQYYNDSLYMKSNATHLVKEELGDDLIKQAMGWV